VVAVVSAFSVDEIRAMSDDAIVLALANPDPEVRLEEPGAESILPDVLHDRVVPAVAGAVAGQR
jgi:hypothetical protein